MHSTFLQDGDISFMKNAHSVYNGENNRHDRLTKREREVLQLIAQGLNNSELATTLFISEITVKTHVSRIMSKLNLTDRTKVAVYAWEKGIINRS